MSDIDIELCEYCGESFDVPLPRHGPRPRFCCRQHQVAALNAKDTRKGDRHSRTAVLIRLTPELKERLVAEADIRERPLAWLVRKLLTESLERLVPVDELRLTKDAS